MIRLDTSRAPVLIARWEGDVDEDELDSYFDAHERLLDSEAEHGVLFDLAAIDAKGTTYDGLCRLFCWLDEHSTQLRETCSACVFVVDDKPLGHTIEGLCEVVTFDVPTRLFDERIEAHAWVRPRLGLDDTPEADASVDPDEETVAANPASKSDDETPTSTSKGTNKPAALEYSECTWWSPYNRHGSGESSPGRR